MRSLFLTLIFLSYFFLGFRAPYIFFLGYVWVDIYTPQLIAYSLINDQPIAMIMGVAVLLSFLTLPKSVSSRTAPFLLLLSVFVVWMTLSLAWAEVPDAAYAKWSSSYKTVIVACLLPFFFQTRQRLEALLWVILASAMGHCIPFGAKVLISGGGYGSTMGLVQANTGWGEGSSLAMFAVTTVPLSLYLIKHNTLLPNTWLTRLMLWGFAVSGVLTALGTFARTGLVSLIAMSVFIFLQTRRKGLVLLLFLLVALGVGGFMGTQWTERMETIQNAGTEGSAMGRVAVWLWTIDYVMNHPWGGSFDVYRIDSYQLPLEDGSVLTVMGKAFHSIYFEVLGELGFPGIVMFLALFFLALFALNRLRRLASAGPHAWIKDLSVTMMSMLGIYMCGGAFIGVAFQPYLYYLIGITAALVNIAYLHAGLGRVGSEKSALAVASP